MRRRSPASTASTATTPSITIPSRNPLDDFPATVAQERSLANFGVRAEVARARGRHNWKAGAHTSRTRLDEEFSLGITDPEFDRALLPYNLARGGRRFDFSGKQDIDQLAPVRAGFDRVGELDCERRVALSTVTPDLTSGHGIQPRAGVSYLVRPTGDRDPRGVQPHHGNARERKPDRVEFYGPGGLAGNLFAGAAEQRPIALGRRDQLDAGIQQSLGPWVLLDVRVLPQIHA